MASEAVQGHAQAYCEAEEVKIADCDVQISVQKHQLFLEVGTVKYSLSGTEQRKEQSSLRWAGTKSGVEHYL